MSEEIMNNTILKIHLIIFSLDRAQQLRLLLNSIHKNSNSLFDITVIFKASSDRFRQGYLKLVNEVVNNVHDMPVPVVFIEEKTKSFRDVLLEILSVNSNYKYTCFMTDDCIMYRKFPDSYKTIDRLFTSEDIVDICTLSLRIGVGTVIQTFYKNDYLKPLNYFNVVDSRDGWSDTKLIIWDRTKYPNGCTYNYPYSVDGHIFPTDRITRFINQSVFDTPNSLESALCLFSVHPESPRYMAGCMDQCLVANPVNIVATAWGNKHGLYHPYGVEELNDKYLSGEVIDLSQMDFSNINCTHQELKFGFKHL